MTAIVTGGGGGLGSAVAALLLDRGHPVALLDTAEAGLAPVAERLGAGTEVPVLAVPCDVASSVAVQSAFDIADHRLGSVNVVINAAGLHEPRLLVETTDEDWSRMMAVNLNGAFYVCRAAARRWLDASRPGSIVNVTSVATMVAAPIGSSSYGASKSGLQGLTIHLAVELGPYGIRVNAIAPGTFRSPMTATRLSQPGEEAKSSARVPLGRVAEVDEVASAAVYLALDATYVNGAVLAVDGGTVVNM